MASVVDQVESWLAGQSFWIQVPILLAVLIPLLFLLAGVIDRVVERILRPHTRREARAAGPHPSVRRAGPELVPVGVERAGDGPPAVSSAAHDIDPGAGVG